MTTFFTDDTWHKSLQAAIRTYGKRHRAVKEAILIDHAIMTGDTDPFRPFRKTKWGESRIPKCTKYDLYDYFRVVTVTYDSVTIVLYFGKKEDAEKWIEKNHGLTFSVNEINEIVKTRKNGSAPIPSSPEERDTYTGKLLDRLNVNLKNDLIGSLPYNQVQPLLDLDAGSNEQTIKWSVSLISDTNLQVAALDTLILLNQGEVEHAQNRIQDYLGSLKELDKFSDEEIIEIKNGTTIKRVPIGSDDYRAWVDSFLNSSKTYEWFLFMHPEQEKFVQADYNGPAKLSGVSGSGKTAIAIARSIRLAKKYKDQQVLIVTINKALAELISDIVSDACKDDSTRSRIDVLSYFELAVSLINEHEPENSHLYTDITIGLGEHKDEIYREFYRCMNNNYSAEVLKNTHFQLMSQGINSEQYISEEFDWIRSTRFKGERSDYLTIERKGRSFPLVQAHREKILIALDAWEQKMLDVGVIDSLGLTTALSKHLGNIKQKYRSVIVDEAQDFGTTELSIIRKLVDEQENDIFLCGDAAQQVQPKRQNFQRAGIIVANRSFKLQKNYRNSREILKIAYEILVNNLSDEHIENSELEISDPEFAVRSSAAPVLLTCADLEQEIAFAIELINENQKDAKDVGNSHMGCVAIAGYSQYEIEEFGKKLGLNVLNGDKKRFETNLFLSDLEQTKGYEFDTMVIVNCNDGVLPPKGVPSQELYRFVSQFYVAMTRAKTQLVLSASKKPSKWLLNARVDLEADPWGDFINEHDIKLVGIPTFLADFPGEDYADVGELSGDQFSYTDVASGMTSDTLEKICKVVPNVNNPNYSPSNETPQHNNMRELYNSLVSQSTNRTKTYFRSSEARDFVSAYLNANLKVELTSGKPSLSEPANKNISKPSANIRFSAPRKRPISEEELNSKVIELRTLDIPPSTYALLFREGVRTLEDLIQIDSRKLRDFLTASKIKDLKFRAKNQIIENAKRHGASYLLGKMYVRIEDAGFRPRTLRVLKEYKIKFIDDLRKLSKAELRANSGFNNSALLEIQRIANDFGVKMKN